jgi:hypothetical protein
MPFLDEYCLVKDVPDRTLSDSYCCVFARFLTLAIPPSYNPLRLEDTHNKSKKKWRLSKPKQLPLTNSLPTASQNAQRAANHYSLIHPKFLLHIQTSTSLSSVINFSSHAGNTFPRHSSTRRCQTVSIPVPPTGSHHRVLRPAAMENPNVTISSILKLLHFNKLAVRGKPEFAVVVSRLMREMGLYCLSRRGASGRHL